MVRPEPNTPPTTDAEVRHVTILKCDLVNSTRTKKLLDLDGQLAFQRGFQQIVTDVVARYDAHIEKFEGDGALVLFGFPQPREDAPESAVRMGMDLVDAIQSAEIVPNVRLQIRVGVASGLIAIVKHPSSPRGDPIAGMIPDMAERLRALADPGQVVIADATKRLAGGFFHYHDLGVLPAKGFDEGVRGWRVAGALPVASRFEAQRFDPSHGGIVGRADTLAQLADAWSSSLTGVGQAVCLVGDAGIGKSRLALAALEDATRDGALTLKIDCSPSAGNTPMFPIAVLLRRTAHIAPTSSEEEKRSLAHQLLARLLPADEVPAALTYLGPLFGLESAAVPADVGPAEVRDKMISTVVQIIIGLAAERPLALLCEDLHWVDDTTAKVIERVAQEIARLPALMIITTRPISEEAPLVLSTCATIVLYPLDPSTAAQLVRSIAKGAALADDTVRQIVDRCEGVPLVLEEVTRSALEAANPRDDAGAAARSDGNLPAPLQLVVQSRLDRWPQFIPIVQSASVLGREFPVRLLQKMGARESEVTEAISVLTREGLFDKPDLGPRDRARFKHVMICEAVYNTLLGSNRQRLHSAIADILSHEHKGTPDAAPDVVAEHLRKARRFTEAARVRLGASSDTAARGAYVETEGHCVAALAIVDEISDPAERTSLEFRLLIQLGVALTGQHGYSAAAAEDTYRRALALCGDSAEAEMLYPIMRGLAAINLVRGNLPAAYDLAQQGLKLADQSKRVEFRLDAFGMLCFTTLYYTRLEDCLDFIKRCLELYRAEQGHRLTYPVPQDAGTTALCLLPTVMWLLGDSQASDEAIRDGLAHIGLLNRDFDGAMFHCWIAGTRITQRRYAEAIKHAGIAAEMAQRNGYSEWHAHALMLGFTAQAASNGDPQAIAHATATYEAFLGAGVNVNAPHYLWGIALGHVQAGDTQNAQRRIAEAFTHAERTRELRMNAELLILQAEIDPNDSNATQMLDRALALADEEGAVATALRAAAVIALRSKGDEARREYAQATLDMLEGRSPYPAQRDWMRDRLTTLRPTLDADSQTMAQA
jgi:class 3 adenylate cyclase